MTFDGDAGRTKTDVRAVSLIADPRFQGLLARLSEHGMSRAEFDTLPMPDGWTTDKTWKALRDIHRAQGIRYRDFWTVDGVPTTQWFTPTKSIDAMLHDLTRRTDAGSRLDCALRERFGRRFITGSLIEEAVAAVSCEGLQIDYEQARRVCLGDADVRRPVERLVANMHALLTGVLEGAFPSIDRRVVEDMYVRLTDGVDIAELGGAIVWGNEWPGDAVPASKAIDEVCAMAAGELVDPYEHPICTSQRIVCHFWRNWVFPSCNYVLGSLVGRLYLTQRGFPVFAYLPISRMTLAWRRGLPGRPGVWPYEASCDIDGLDYDWTLYWESCLRLMLDEACAFEESVLQVKEEDDRILEHLRDDRSFNHRQRAVLERAVLDPAMALRIEGHRARYGLAYSTARQDLTSLVGRGLLQMRYEGKAQVFAASGDFKRRLGARYKG